MFKSSKPSVVVLGAGFAGLTAADYLKTHDVPLTVYEAGKNVAGLARSECDADGFTYDCGAHFITNRLAAAVGVAAECRPMTVYGESVWVGRKTKSYPFGLMTSPKYVLSALAAKVKSVFAKKNETATDYYRSAYGRTLADEIALPLTEAWSGCPTNELAASVGQKFATGLIRTVGLKCASRITKRVVGIGYSQTITESPHAWHVYPNGGIGAVCERLADRVKPDIRTESPVDSIEVENDRVVGVRVRGEFVPARAVISTAPVTVLAKLVRGSDRLSHLSKFRYRAMIFVNLKIQGPSGLSDVVTWTPETSLPFFRLSDIGRGLPFLVPVGKSQVTCDIGCQIGDDLWKTPDGQLADCCVAGLETMMPGIRSRVLGHRVVRTGLAYPVYRLEYEAERLEFGQGTGIEGLISVGRNGEFSHSLMEDVYWRTRWKTAALINP